MPLAPPVTIKVFPFSISSSSSVISGKVDIEKSNEKPNVKLSTHAVNVMKSVGLCKNERGIDGWIFYSTKSSMKQYMYIYSSPHFVVGSKISWYFLRGEWGHPRHGSYEVLRKQWLHVTGPMLRFDFPTARIINHSQLGSTNAKFK